MFGNNSLANIVYAGKQNYGQGFNQSDTLGELLIFLPGETVDGYSSDIDAFPSGEMSSGIDSFGEMSNGGSDY
jgi:hypothetical protein